ncbi:MAG: sulfotransferase [Chloroflexota bacterium]|nr:MAG: sulfotransferase [Chloroflexota bacterium]
MPQPDHIFIVGLGRTGSTLTRSILNCSPEVGIGGESHYFRDLPRLGSRSSRSFRSKLARAGNLKTDAGARAVVAMIFGKHPRHDNFWNLTAKGVDRAEFLNNLLASDRSERALFDLAMAYHAGGKPVRGEKTPAHIYFVPELLEWFPNSKVIHTFRDPRAIFMSRKKKAEKKNLSFFSRVVRKLGLVFELISSLHLITNWLRVARLHRQYQQRFPNRYILSHYEDLVCDPAGSLRDLCAFLEIEFSEAMLEQSVVNSSFVQKDQVVAGFDIGAIDRWREHMDPLLKRWFLFWCKKELDDFDYAA